MRMLPTTRTARLTRVQDGIALHCTYPPDLVAAVKSWIPAPERTWDYDGRCWRVNVSQEPTLRALLAALDYRVDER
jgi:hypothetical protein